MVKEFHHEEHEDNEGYSLCLFFVTFVLFVVKLAFLYQVNKTNFYHEEHEDNEE